MAENSKNDKPEIYTVYLVDESRKKLVTSPNTTVQQLFDMMCEKLDIKSRELFALADRIEDPPGVLADRFLCLSKTLAEENLTPESYIVFKLKYVKRYKHLDDPVAEDLIFQQIEKSVVKEVYPCPEKIAIKLAGYELQSKFGDFDPKRHRVGYLNKVGLQAFLPLTVSRHDYAYWQERLFAVHSNLKGLSPRESKRQYVEAAREIPFFGMTFFEVKDDNDNIFAIGICEEGLYLFRASDLTLAMALTFGILLNWKQVGNSLELKFTMPQSTDVQTHFYTSTGTQVAEMIKLLDEYYALLSPELKSDKVIPNNPNPTVSDPNLFLPPHTRVFLGRFCSRLEYLKGYYMEGCSLGNLTPVRKFCFQIDKSIDHNTILEHVDVSSSGLSDKGLEVLLLAVQKTIEYVPEPGYPWSENFDIQALDLSNNAFTVTMIPQIVGLLAVVPKIRSFNLSGAIIDNKGAIALANGFKMCTHLERLELSRCSVGNKGIVAIMESCPKLAVLNVSDNRIGDPGVQKAICPVLESSDHLVELYIANNKIDLKGFDALFKSAQKSTHLTHLDISNNHEVVGSKLGARILPALEKNTSLKRLIATGLSFDTETETKLIELLKSKNVEFQISS